MSRWQIIAPCRRRVVMWGAADQGRVNAPILRALGCEIAALVDDTVGMASPFDCVPLLAGWAGLESWLASQAMEELGFVIAIGNPYGHVRTRLHDKLVARGLASISFADPASLLCGSAGLGEGLQVMAQALVHNDARIGRQCIVNTRALVEHDCVLEDGVEIGPGATLCGRVHVGANSWIGAGAVIRPRIHIGRNVIVGVGAAVVSDIPDGAVAVGVPARPIPGKTTASAKAESQEGKEY
jgi:sugar O-acyltransferase (sialic acid O-acetyltransferase NeuD family)